MDARLVKHHVDQSVGALTDIAGTIQFCEKQIWNAAGDHSMRPDTEEVLSGTARALAMLKRLLDWELEAMERLASTAEREAES